MISFKKSHYSKSFEGIKVSKENIIQIIINLKSDLNINISFKSNLLKEIFQKQVVQKWVDIEIEFFRSLINAKKNGMDEVKRCNSQFEFIKKKFIEYLTLQQENYKKGIVDKSIIECFIEQISNDEIIGSKIRNVNSLYFLNFNYTDTIIDYFQECEQYFSSSCNFIHGSLDGQNGSPVFGFGDEFDKRYVEFEDENNNELFKHIKSFEYLQTQNYFKLTRFVEADNFQVHIYGHSCGISDRTMLNQIFEHTNCKSIKIFYHKINENETDFTEKTYEISRHFKDKGLLRKKLVPFDLSREMPQPLEPPSLY